MKERIREIDAFYEVGGRFELDEAWVSGILGAAIDRVQHSTYAEIGVRSLSGLRLPPGTQEVNPDDTLPVSGKGTHTALFTTRRIKPLEENPDAFSPGVAVFQYASRADDAPIIQSRFIVQVLRRRRLFGRKEPANGVAIGVTAHEVAHTFGVQHCRFNRCIMQGKTTAEYLELKGGDPHPFCYTCTNSIRIATNRHLDEPI